jgi:hypothetical protein
MEITKKISMENSTQTFSQPASQQAGGQVREMNENVRRKIKQSKVKL